MSLLKWSQSFFFWIKEGIFLKKKKRNHKAKNSQKPKIINIIPPPNLLVAKKQEDMGNNQRGRLKESSSAGETEKEKLIFENLTILLQPDNPQTRKQDSS